MKTVKDILAGKGSAVETVAPGARVEVALKTMADKNIGSLVVVDKGKVAGIFSERDYARGAAAHPGACRDALVKEMMSGRVLYVTPDDTIEQCMTLMTNRRLRHLPVMDGEKLAGLVSIGDVVNVIIHEQKNTISQLERYISGT
jgi:CBS domain-containing protein